MAWDKKNIQNEQENNQKISLLYSSLIPSLTFMFPLPVSTLSKLETIEETTKIATLCYTISTTLPGVLMRVRVILKTTVVLNIGRRWSHVTLKQPRSQGLSESG